MSILQEREVVTCDLLASLQMPIPILFPAQRRWLSLTWGRNAEPTQEKQTMTQGEECRTTPGFCYSF